MEPNTNENTNQTDPISAGNAYGSEFFEETASNPYYENMTGDSFSQQESSYQSDPYQQAGNSYQSAQQQENPYQSAQQQENPYQSAQYQQPGYTPAGNQNPNIRNDDYWKNDNYQQSGNQQNGSYQQGGNYQQNTYYQQSGNQQNGNYQQGGYQQNNNYQQGNAYQQGNPYQQSQYQSAYSQNAAPRDPNQPSGSEVASLVLGILSLIMCNPLFAIIGLILSSSASKQNHRTNTGKAGFVCSLIGLILTIVCIVGFILLIAIAEVY